MPRRSASSSVNCCTSASGSARKNLLGQLFAHGHQQDRRLAHPGEACRLADCRVLRFHSPAQPRPSSFPALPVSSRGACSTPCDYSEWIQLCNRRELCVGSRFKCVVTCSKISCVRSRSGSASASSGGPVPPAPRPSAGEFPCPSALHRSAHARAAPACRMAGRTPKATTTSRANRAAPHTSRAPANFPRHSAPLRNRAAAAAARLSSNARSSTVSSRRAPRQNPPPPGPAPSGCAARRPSAAATPPHGSCVAGCSQPVVHHDGRRQPPHACRDSPPCAAPSSRPRRCSTRSWPICGGVVCCG